MEPISFTRVPSVGTSLVPTTWVSLCDQLGWLYAVDQDAGVETPCFVWQSDRHRFASAMSPLLLACRVARLFDARQAVRFPEAEPDQEFEIVWLNVSRDDTLSVVLRPRIVRR